MNFLLFSPIVMSFVLGVMNFKFGKNGKGLLIYKYLVLGMGEAGHIVADYTNVAERSFTHRELDSRRLFERFPSLGLE